MRKLFVFFVTLWSMTACDSPHQVKKDVGGNNGCNAFTTPDVPDIIDVFDVPDLIDVPDVPQDVEIPTDPHEHLITCNRKLAAVHYNYIYYDNTRIHQEDGYKNAITDNYQFDFESGIERLISVNNKGGYGTFSYINPNILKKFTAVRSIRYQVSPSVDGEFGKWILTVTDVLTGITHEWDPGVELLSEDCLAYDLFNPAGRSVMSVWIISDDEREAIFSCEGSSMDVYKMDLVTGEITYFLRGLEEMSPFSHTKGVPSLQNYGGDFISFYLSGYYWIPEIRVWNWRTGERVWTFSNSNLAGVWPFSAEDGWVYYTLREQRGNDWYLKVEGYNFLTGETGSLPMVKDNTLLAKPAIQGRPEYIFFMAGDGPVSSSGLPTGEKHYYLWNRETDVVRRITRVPINYGIGILALGQTPPQTAIYSRAGGTYPCYYYKNLMAAGIMDAFGNLLPEP